ncbi:hypothetical protein [Paeniglutamicibacter cryotolerans]|uniref:Uncharacterized protein n=1 Tax=Paeniglutamicibacter cryotolerans TaxID=670079 RepID=A0A839QM73_9MICC|nr:hypothetical protein [Paeniglutamicibacter cryotolerans]MBB2995106.1 hypothetical protein [Paeniglutamicibacter cryotolerans]
MNNLHDVLHHAGPKERKTLLATAPDLFTITRPRLFGAGVRPSPGAVSKNCQLDPDNESRIDWLVLALVESGAWSPELVLEGIASFRVRHSSAFQLRWIAGLETLLRETLPVR